MSERDSRRSRLLPQLRHRAEPGPDDSPEAPAPSSPARQPAAAAPRRRRSFLLDPGLQFDAKRWTRADEIAGVATILLFISLFLPWFTISVSASHSGSGNGLWHGWMFITLILCILIVAYLVLRAGWTSSPSRRACPTSP